MKEVRIPSGHHYLDVIQNQGATQELILANLSLKPFHRGRTIKETLGELLSSLQARSALSEKRLKAVQHDQSNESFRPFLELLLNSIDYGGDTLKIYAVQQNDGGWRVVIGDKPEGEGMDARTFLNTYLDPYASLSAEHQLTPRGEFKKGLMGVGAQQQFGLLRHKDDKLIVSAASESGIVVGSFVPNKKGRIEMTLGGRKTLTPGSGKGVVQVLQLGGETCKEIGFSPENLAAYLHERLAILSGRQIDMVILHKEAKGVEKSVHHITSLDNNSSERALVREAGSDVTLAIANHTSDHARVYLNVLGVRFGEPIIVQGKNLPAEIDICFEHPMQVNEARNSVVYTKSDYQKIVRLIEQFSASQLLEDAKADTRLRLGTYEALQPLLQQINVQNEWKIEKGCNPTTTLERVYKEEIKQAISKGFVVLPLSLVNVIEGVTDDAIYCSDERVMLFAQDAFKEAKIQQMHALGPMIYRARLKTNTPFWVSPKGEMVIFNEKYFPGELTKIQIIRAKALLENLQASARLSRSFRINSSTSYQPIPAQRTLPITYRKEEVSPDEKERYGQLVEKVKKYVAITESSWEEYSLEQKKEAINELIRLQYVENPYVSPLDKVERGENGFFDLGGILGRHRQRWYEFSERQINMLWTVIYLGMQKGTIQYIRKEEDYKDIWLPFIVDLPNFSSGVAYQMLSAYKERLTLTIWKDGLSEYAANPYFLELCMRHEKQIYNFHKEISTSIDTADWEFFIKYAKEYADIVGLPRDSQERKVFLEVFSSKEFLQRQIDILQNIGLGGYADRELLYNYPHELASIQKLIQTYEPEFLAMVFWYKDISPTKLLTILIPAMQALGVDMMDEKTVRGICNAVSLSEDEISRFRDRLSSKELLFWQIYHDKLPLQRRNEQQFLPIGREIDPARLLSLSLARRERKIAKAKDIHKLLARQSFGEKEKARMRELEHMIDHLDHTPGSSLLEIFKNSWQAIAREQLPQEKRRVNFTDGYHQRDTAMYYQVAVQDFVGMHPRDALRQLLLPGEGKGMHGIHFLSVLKDFDEVQVRTSKGKQVGIITLQVIRGERNTTFKVFYEEIKNNQDSPFVGTTVTMSKEVSPQQLQTQSAVMRQRIAEFGIDIPKERVEVLLNGELVNKDHKTTFVTHNEIGSIEIHADKSFYGGGIRVAVDDLAMPRYDITSVISRCTIPESAKKILINAGFQLNIVGPQVKLTRDNASFQDVKRVERSLQDLFQHNWQSILTGVVTSGFDLDTQLEENQLLFPRDIWSDKAISGQLRHTPGLPLEKVEWDNVSSISSWVLTQPILQYQKESYSLARIIHEYLTDTLPGELFSQLPTLLKFKLQKGKENYEDQQLENIELPQEVERFLGSMVERVEACLLVPHNPIKMGAYRGGVRGMKTYAFYDVAQDAYFWNERIIEYAREAMQGNVDAYAKVFEVVCHEAQHRKLRSEEDLLSHTGNFYQAVQQAILSVPIP